MIMIRIGKYEFGFAPFSMAVLFVVLSIVAVLSAIYQARPEFPMPLTSLIIINECFALMATLVYGILLHLTISFITYIKRRKRRL